MTERAPGRGGPSRAEAFEQLLLPLLDPAYRLALSLTRDAADAEDVVQEAALRAFRAFDTFAQGTNFKAWFYRILTNCCFARHRSRVRSPELVDLEDAEKLYLFKRTREAGLHEQSADPAKALMEKLSLEKILEAMTKIPVEYSAVCALYFLEDCAYQEIADILGVPVGTVRSRLHRGRRILQKALWGLALESGIITHPGSRQATA